MKCYIKENSFIARMAAWKLGVSNVAIVIGKTIHLHNVCRKDFVRDTRWLRHEVAHLKQFQQNGFLGFTMRYLWESVLNGYTNNKYELEARAAENNQQICSDLVIV